MGRSTWRTKKGRLAYYCFRSVFREEYEIVSIPQARRTYDLQPHPTSTLYWKFNTVGRNPISPRRRVHTVNFSTKKYSK